MGRRGRRKREGNGKKGDRRVVMRSIVGPRRPICSCTMVVRRIEETMHNDVEMEDR